jgi:sodium-dependent dicarboxylate transporter 2/3/5
LFLWPGAVALGRILVATGATKVIGKWLSYFIGLGDAASIGIFSLAATVFSGVSTDTSAAGVLVPITIEAFKTWQGLEFGSVAFIWIVGASVSWAYSVASATGAHGIVAGFGANLKRMFVFGIFAAIISWLVTFIYFIITVLILKLDFYILPP